MAANTGWNPASGPDQGGPPPTYAQANPLAGYTAQYPGHYPYYYQQAGAHQPMANAPVPMPVNQHSVPVFPDQPPRFPQPHPVVSSEYPALNLTNSTGGVGCEPGYNYFFPAEHTKVHVIKSTTPPWNVASGHSLGYVANHVPVDTTVANFLKGFGACNPDIRLNRATEVHQGSNGRWYKGLTVAGDDADVGTKTIKQLGWNATRTGRPGEKAVVWVWVTKS